MVNEMTKFDEDVQLYSDLYKDVHGFRPRFDFSSWTPEMFDKEFAHLEEELVQENIRLEKEQKEAIKDFEARVGELIENGAADRATAIQWLMDSVDARGDYDYLCYEFGLPYRYLAK